MEWIWVWPGDLLTSRLIGVMLLIDIPQYLTGRQVLEYFDAFLVGLTATPAKQTFGFFNKNLVMEYGHERAVADGVNGDFEVPGVAKLRIARATPPPSNSRAGVRRPLRRVVCLGSSASGVSTCNRRRQVRRAIPSVPRIAS